MSLPQRTRRLGGFAPTLGLLVDWLEDEYQNAVMQGAADAARERTFNLICYSGGVLESPARNGRERNQVFDLASSRNVSGLLVMSGTLGNYVGSERLAEYCERYADLPRCSIGTALSGMPNVTVDNQAGMREAVEHLIRVHGKRRIFFVRGPAVNEEAESRFAVFRAVLAENGIEHEDSRHFIGDFQPEAGREAMGRALDSSVEFDAVVAANDSMAMGVLEALTARGVRVPEDVALVGFDDVEEARFLEPPLTTVRQPLYEQGKHAVRLLAAAMQGVPSKDDVVLRTQLVVRRSCGCTPGGQLETNAGASNKMSLEATLISKRDLITAELLRAAQSTFGGLRAGWETRLLTALTDDLSKRTPGAFMGAYQDALTQASRTQNPLHTWHDVLAALRRHVLAAVSSDIEIYKHAEQLFHEAGLATSQMVERVQAKKRIDAEYLARRMARASAALIGTFDEEALFAACREHLPALGVQPAYIVRRRKGDPVSRLIFAFEGESLSLQKEVTFSPDEVLPEAFRPADTPYTVIVEPLFFGGFALGYLVLGFGPRNGSLYESLRDQVSAALYGARLADRRSILPLSKP